MKRRNFLKIIGLGAISLSPAGCLMAGKASRKRPNIIFVLIDDMGWRDLGCCGSTYYETPNIDRLASQGMMFTDAYSCGPNCAPTRASLMSGQYTPRHGIVTVGNSNRGPAHLRKLIPVENKTVLDAGITTVAEALKPAGYVSASMGKWHLGNDPEHGPVGQGFDLNVGGYEAGHPRSYFSPYKNPELKDGPKGEYLTDRLTDEALKFIEDNKDKPFFLYLPHYAVHTPIRAKKNMIAKYKAKQPSNGQGNPIYAAMIESTDQGVGRIMARLDELGLTDETIVIFSSDNGGVGGYKELGIKGGEITSNAPLRGGKGMLYEGGIRVPLLVRWPGVVKPGSRCDTPAITVDFYPTLLEIAGAARPAKQVLDGRSIVPLLKGAGSLKREAIFWHFPAYLQGSGGTWRTTPAGAVRQGEWKLLEFFENGRLELYNLERDIGEKNDLARILPEKTKELHNLLRNWRKSVNATVPTQLNPKYEPKGTI
ncbi:MAG: aryl-sulfate sulfohydrolase [Planctomycetes bacterium B3_Pla]|nr:MAG: aryl-sulfate sulfohydrolase [Planctomycetes bacterium B3_Pla]